MTDMKAFPVQAKALFDLGRISLHPAVDRRVIDADATIGQHGFEIRVADPVAAIPSHSEMPPLKIAHSPYVTQISAAISNGAINFAAEHRSIRTKPR